MLFRVLFSIIIVALSSSIYAQDAEQEMQRIQKMRGLAYSATANLMVFYNLDVNPFEPNNYKNYVRSIAELKQMATGHNYESITSDLTKIEDLAAQLYALPRDTDYIRTVALPYQRLLNPLYDSQQHIDQKLAERYEILASGSSNDSQKQLHALSLDHSRIMLQYAMLSLTALAYINPQDPTLSIIDTRIEQQFEKLKTANMDVQGERLDKLFINYNFIRRKLVGQPRPWISGRALYYLSINVEALDNAAAIQIRH